MSRVWTVIIQELVANIRRRSYLLMTFGFPVLIILAVVGYGLIKGDDADEPADPLEGLPDKPAGYVDLSGLLGDPGDLALFLVRYDSKEKAQAAVEAGEISSYYLVPADYMATGQVFRYSLQFNLVESDMGLFQAFLVRNLLGEESPLLLARLESPAYVIEHQLSRSGGEVAEIEGSGFANFGLVYSFALIMMMSTFFSASQLMRSVIVEKENRMIEIALSSVRPLQLLTGKVIGQGLAGLIQILTWLGGVLVLIEITDANIPLIGTVDLPPSLFVIAVLYFLGGYLLFAAFAAGIGAISINMREGPQYAVVYSLPAVLPLLFLAQILVAPNGVLAVSLSFFPLCSPLGMIQRLAVSAVPGWQIATSLAILFVSVVGALWLAARLFRVNSLLSGQLPTRKELIQLLIRG